MTTKQSSEELMSGKTLGHFRLLVSLGVGGMGQVWAAHDSSAPGERVVALKTNHSTGAEALRVLWDEARLASLIQHPNVCPVYELAEEGSVSFLVMQWCDGATLHDLLEVSPQGRLPIGLAARVVANVAAGLQAAHDLIGPDGAALKVVHRDVSPQNILLSTRGAISVTDFGVAKAAGQAHRPTETGEMKGKLSYMAPEQVKSKDIDHRVDIFALGCVLYQATLGQRPFHGGDALATMYKLLEETVVPPREIDPEYPPELEAIVLKALEKDRNERYQTAEELQEALEKWLVSTRTLMTNSDVANHLMATLGKRIRERNDRVFRVLRRQETSDPPDAAAAVPQENSNSSVGATVSGANHLAPRQKSSLARVAGGMAAVALLAAMVVVWINKGDSDTPAASNAALQTPATPPATAALASIPAPTPAASVVEPPPPQPARLVEISLAVNPKHAEIWLDGEKVGEGTFFRSTRPSSEPRSLEVRADNYFSEKRDILFDRTQALTISLTKVTRKAGSPRATPKKPEKPELPLVQQTGPRKPPRSLDNDNPFATESD